MTLPGTTGVDQHEGLGTIEIYVDRSLSYRFRVLNAQGQRVGHGAGYHGPDEARAGALRLVTALTDEPSTIPIIDRTAD